MERIRNDIYSVNVTKEKCIPLIKNNIKCNSGKFFTFILKHTTGTRIEFIEAEFVKSLIKKFGISEALALLENCFSAYYHLVPPDAVILVDKPDTLKKHKALHDIDSSYSLVKKTNEEWLIVCYEKNAFIKSQK